MITAEKLLKEHCDRMTDIECNVFYGKDGVLKAMEEYGRYCAISALKRFAFTALFNDKFNELVEEWWNGFKSIENEKTT